MYNILDEISHCIERKINVKKTAFVLITGMLMLLTACGGVVSQYDTNTLVIAEDSIQEISVEDYSGLNVTKEELQSYIDEQIAAFETADAVVMNELAFNGSIAKLAISYDSMETYNAFNGTDYELIPASEWKYKSSQIKNMVSLENGSLEEEEVKAFLEDADTEVLIINASIDVKLKGDILAFCSAEYVEEDTLHADEGTIIIFK